MAHHHHSQSGTYPPPLFAAELDATQPGRVFSPEGNPAFEMAGDSVPTQHQQQKADGAKARPERQETEPPAQANPWPFYLDDEGRKQQLVASPVDTKEQTLKNSAPGRYDGAGYPDEYGEDDEEEEEPEPESARPAPLKVHHNEKKEPAVPAALAINFTGHSAVSKLSTDSHPATAAPVSPTHTGTSTPSYVPAALHVSRPPPQASQTVQSPVSPRQYKAYHPPSTEDDKKSPTKQTHTASNVSPQATAHSGTALAYRPYRRPSFEEESKPSNSGPALAAASAAVAVATQSSSPAPAPAPAAMTESTPPPVAMHSVAPSAASPPPAEPVQSPHPSEAAQPPYPTDVVQPPYPSEPAQPPYPEGVAPHHSNVTVPPAVPEATRPPTQPATDGKGTPGPVGTPSSQEPHATSPATTLYAHGSSQPHSGHASPPPVAETVLWPPSTTSPQQPQPQANISSPGPPPVQPQAPAPVPVSPPVPAPASAPEPIAGPSHVLDPTPIPVQTEVIPEAAPIPVQTQPAGPFSPQAPVALHSPSPPFGSPAPAQPTPGFVPQPTYSTDTSHTEAKPSKFPQFPGADQIPIQDPPPPYVPSTTHGAGSYSVPSEKPSLFPPPPQSVQLPPQSQFPTQPTYFASNSQPVSNQPSPHATPSPYGQPFPQPQPQGTPSPYGQPPSNAPPTSYLPSPIQGVNSPPSPYAASPFAPSPIQGTNAPPGPYGAPPLQGQPVQYAQPQGPPPTQGMPGQYGYAPPVGQPYYAEGVPPLPPRPSTAQGTMPAVGFSSNPINPVAYPPPPKTHYIPPPPNSTLSNYQKPGGSKIGSVAGKWLGKANQVLENKIEEILQGHPDPKYRPQQQQYPPGAFYTNNNYAPPQQGQWQAPQQPQYGQPHGPPPS